MFARSILAAITSVALFSTLSFAETNLPYIGPRQAACKVNQPKGEISEFDGGYLSDETCNFIYVKPPVLGQMQLNKPFILKLADICPSHRVIRKNIQESTEKDSANLKGDALINRLRDAGRALDALDKVGSEKTVSYVSGIFKLGWERLTNEYTNLNPGREVRTLPISIGLFSASTFNSTDSSNPVMDLLEEGSDAIRSFQVEGLAFPGDAPNAADFPIPSLLTKLISEKNPPFLMGQALSFNMQLNLAGTCAMLDDEMTVVSSPALLGTYTYFFPVQTKASYAVIWNGPALAEKIFQVAFANGDRISADELRASFPADPDKIGPMLRININDGAFPVTGEGDKLKNEFKEDILKYTLQMLLSSIAEEVNTSITNATTVTEENHVERHCKSSWFGLVKKCADHHYRIVRKNIDWKAVNESVKRVIPEKVESEAASYRSFFMMDTSGFTPQVRN